MEGPGQPISRRSERIRVELPVALWVKSDPQRIEHTGSTIDPFNHSVRMSSIGGLVLGQHMEIVTHAESGCAVNGHIVWIGPVGSRLEGHAGTEFMKPLPNFSLTSCQGKYGT